MSSTTVSQVINETPLCLVALIIQLLQLMSAYLHTGKMEPNRNDIANQPDSFCNSDLLP